MEAALWVAKTGLDAQQTRMTVISNNLANVNTTGFKRDRATFEDLLYQAGYIASEGYLEFNFEKIAVKCFKIIEGFPRISTLNERIGIDSLSYTLHLDACIEYEDKPNWWNNIL